MPPAAGNQAVYTELARFGVSTVYEGNGRSGLIDADLVQLIPGVNVAGPARTAACAQGDNTMVHAILERLQPGDVLVASFPEAVPIALMGDLMVLQAAHRNIAGALLNGAVRDVDECRRIGLPIWARFVRSRTAEKGSPGQLDVPLTFGGTTIHPGDIVVMDGDGAVVVPRARLDTVLAACRTRETKEIATREAIARGELTYDMHGLRAAVEGAGRR